MRTLCRRASCGNWWLPRILAARPSLQVCRRCDHEHGAVYQIRYFPTKFQGVTVRIAYLILAHNNPAHLQRLVHRLAAQGATFYVHIDAKSNLNAFSELRASVTFCTQRVNCAWGDISLVKATLELMKCAAAAQDDIDYFVLLSGACYPLRSPAYIGDFLTRHRGTEFIEVFSLPNVAYNKPIERLTRYWIRKGSPFGRFRWPLQRFINKHLPLRNYQMALAGGEPVTGSQWWCLSGEAVRHVLDVTEQQPDLYRFCKFVDCPDEFYFQFILWNSRFRASVSHSLTYTHWQPGTTGPELLDARYLTEFEGLIIYDSQFNNCPSEKREVLFGRKFDDASGAVLNAIDVLADRPHATVHLRTSFNAT